MLVQSVPENETDFFIQPRLAAAPNATVTSQTPQSLPNKDLRGRCQCFRGCIYTISALAIILLALGLVALFFGRQIMSELILKSMAITPDSMAYGFWLRPPVEPNVLVFALHLTNPDEVLKGQKPVMQERGPYAYRVETIRDNIRWHEEDFTLSYNERKIFTFDPQKTGPGLDPDKDVVTIPNVPLWAGLLAGKRTESDIARAVAREMVTTHGRRTPFINVTVGGFLWGYEDDLPCLEMDVPAGCGDNDDDEDDAFSWEHSQQQTKDPQNPAAFVGCQCVWGLLRGKNDTIWPRIRFHTGGGNDRHLKGRIVEYAGAKTLHFWRRGSTCDSLGSQDGPTLPPQVPNDTALNIFFAIICRTIPLSFEKEVFHGGFKTHRLLPPASALGSNNQANVSSCYCPRGVPCFKSGAYSIESCTKAPVAVSYPHFYLADPEYMLAGLHPQRDRHQFYMDLEPNLGLPMAGRARFQLNAVIGRGLDEGWDEISGMEQEILVPFVWAEEGFDEPSKDMLEVMALLDQVRETLPMVVAAVAFVMVGAAVLTVLTLLLWQNRRRKREA